MDTTALDEAIDQLHDGADSWVQLSLPNRAALLAELRTSVAAAAQDWATTAAASKGLGSDHPLRGEEWLSGPYAVLGALDSVIVTLRRLSNGGSPLDGVAIDDAPGGRVRAHVLPQTASDRVMLSGFTGEVWLRPGVSVADAVRRAGLAQRTPAASGGVGLVLGAGNITSIPVLDVLYELLSANRTVILKINPTQHTLAPIFARALAPLIERGFLRIVEGGGDVGAVLTQHPGIDHVHITGSVATFETIAATLDKPITAELGGVAPIIVVPGPWTDADLRHQAEHIATMRLHNSGHNCIAGQVVIISADWAQRDAFMSALRTAYESAPARPVWYPHAAERMQTVTGAESFADDTRMLVRMAQQGSPLETTEYFAPVLGVTELGGHGQEFLDAAIAYANDRLTGTLGANVLIDPQTEAALGADVDHSLADLRYGAIAVNAWTGIMFTVPTLSWGAFPGSTIDDVGSGIGVVHNALLLDDVERSVLRGPFRPFPRSLTPGSTFTVLPTPPWFVSARTAADTGEGLTRIQAGAGIGAVVRTLTQVMRG